MDLYRIDFPAYIKNNEKAINMLGGNKYIFNQFNSNSPEFQINFRPGDVLSHSIKSTELEDPSISIKIKIKRIYKIQNGKKNLLNEIFEPIYIGRSNKCYSFNQPSDFQFLQPLTFSYSEQTVIDPPPQNYLYLPPPTFLHNTRYGVSYIQRRIFASHQSEKMKIWTKADCPWIINQNLLLTLEKGPTKPKPAIDIDLDLLNVFEECFSLRPIWTSLSLIDFLVQKKEKRGNILKLNEQNQVFFHTLASVAYYIKNGPFKLCWIKYGINPLNHFKYKIFQTIVLSLKSWEFAADLQKKFNKTTGFQQKFIEDLPIGISSLNTLPNRLFYALQLIDLNEDYIQNSIKNHLENYNFQSGWFSNNIITNIRKFCLLKLQRMLNNENYINLMDDILNDNDLHKTLEKINLEKPKKNLFDYVFQNIAQEILNIYDNDPLLNQDDVTSILNKQFLSISLTDRILSF